MNRQMNIKKTIEAQRERMDKMSERTDNLTELLEEAQRMDWLIGIYETKRSTGCIRKMHKDCYAQNRQGRRTEKVRRPCFLRF